MSNTNFTTSLVQNKMGLLNLARELSNISKACKIMGVSRDTFYRYQEAQEHGGLEGLLSKSRKNPNHKNRVDPLIEQATIDIAYEQPAWGQTRASNELKARGMSISSMGVRGVWVRNSLETLKKRLENIEKIVAKNGNVLTETQLKALEKKENEREAHGEIETHHPGYLVSQDTFYVGTLKGVGRVYQQTVVDTYSKMAFAKLYQMKTALPAADILNDKVLPFFQEQNVDILRMLTDRGTEFCGRPEDHEYQLFLAINDIDHTKTKARHPQTNGICERFHRTILEEFYQSAFRKKIYTSIDDLQNDLDNYLHTYNHKRTHQGKMCCGRTPWQTFLDGRKLWDEKNISSQFVNDDSRAAGGPTNRPLEAAIDNNPILLREVVLTEQTLK
jgi:transposase InsO family protein